MSKPFQFGEKVGFVSLSHPAMLGGVGAGAAGFTSGLIAPGEYEDADGNVKKRSRIGSALRRALMLGAGGVGAGMAYDYFSPRRRPDYPQKYDVKTRQPIVNPLLHPQPTDMERKMLESFASADSAKPDYGVPGGRIGPPEAPSRRPPAEPAESGGTRIWKGQQLGFPPSAASVR